MSDKINIFQFRGLIYRPTPRVAGLVADHLLRSVNPETSNLHRMPRETMVRHAQDALNRYRDKRDAGPEGIEQDYADWIGQAIRARRQP